MVFGGFDRFCSTNLAYWVENASPGQVAAEPRFIFVDLWHDNVQYLLRSLLVAKYLQRVQAAELIGLAGLPGVVPRSCGAIDLAFVEGLAGSFGVNRIVHTSSAGLTDYARADDILDRLEPADVDTSSDLLRQRLAGLELEDGFPIGRFIYDTTLRSELQPTIERIDARLRHWAADCLRMHRWTQELIQDYAGAAITFVTGHLDYNPWGLLGEAIRRAGGEVLWFRLEANVPLVRIGPRQPGTLNEAYHRAEAEWFERLIWPLRKDLKSSVRKFVNQSASGILHQRWTATCTSALPATTAKAAAAALRRSYGWTHADVVVGIFAHALSDQALAGEQAYADRFQWLSETLAFAARHPERRWIVKLHPRDGAYDKTGSTAELEQRFGRLTHIRFVRARVLTGLMEALCDCAVTLFGAPGLEFAVAGRPVIVAGDGPYADCGFVHRAKNRAHYEALLLADPASLQIGSEQVERAQLYAYAARVIGAAASPLLDPIPTAATETYWHLAEARLRHHSPESDDLNESIWRLASGSERRSSNPNLHRFCRSSEASEPEAIATAPLPLLESEPLRFCAGGSGVPGLLMGFDAPDITGVWATERAAVIGFCLGGPSISGVARLSLAYRSIGSEPDWPWPVARVFIHQSCLIDRISLEQMGTIEIDVPASVVMDDNVIVLAILVDHLGAPAAMGLNADTRALGIGLISVARLT